MAGAILSLVKLSGFKGGDFVDEKTDLISAAEAAKILGVSREAIRAREEHGSLVPAAIEWRGAQRRPKFRRSDVEALRPNEDSSSVRRRATALT